MKLIRYTFLFCTYLLSVYLTAITERHDTICNNAATNPEHLGIASQAVDRQLCFPLFPQLYRANVLPGIFAPATIASFHILSNSLIIRQCTQLLLKASLSTS